jgi:hypothetical protein
MEKNECKQCPSMDGKDHERFYIMGRICIDVVKAKELLAKREVKTSALTRKDIEAMGFVLSNEPRVDEKGVKYFSIPFYGHVEEHLAHIPTEKLEAPMIFVRFMFENSAAKRNLATLRKAIKLLQADEFKELRLQMERLAETYAKEAKERKSADYLIDGTHRTIRRYREGAEKFTAVLLTPEESLACITGMYEDDFNRMGLFTVERKKLKKGRAA